MKYLRQFGVFWYHFIVGDDWRIAAGVAIGLGLTAALIHSVHIQAWWLMPIMVVTMLTFSLWLASRR